MDTKLYSVVGTSNLHGIIKFRVANGNLEDRKRVLERLEHVDVKLVTTPEPMLKDAAIAWYVSQNPDLGNIRRPNEPKPKKTATKA
jgi:hypothetical protein